MDDPVQSKDDINVLSLIDLLRVEMNSNNTEKRFADQLFLSTYEEDIENLIVHKQDILDWIVLT